MPSPRIAALEKQCAKRGKNAPASHFQRDYHASARAMTYAIVNQEAEVLPGDTIGGRAYHPVKMLELMITGGVCLKTGKEIGAFHARKSLAGYDDFESFYSDFIKEADRLTKIYLHEQVIYSELAQKARPSYLISSMIDDCLERVGGYSARFVTLSSELQSDIIGRLRHGT